MKKELLPSEQWYQRKLADRAARHVFWRDYAKPTLQITGTFVVIGLAMALTVLLIGAVMKGCNGYIDARADDVFMKRAAELRPAVVTNIVLQVVPGSYYTPTNQLIELNGATTWITNIILNGDTFTNSISNTWEQAEEWNRTNSTGSRVNDILRGQGFQEMRRRYDTNKSPRWENFIVTNSILVNP